MFKKNQNYYDLKLSEIMHIVHNPYVAADIFNKLYLPKACAVVYTASENYETNKRILHLQIIMK